jgi:CheY-like chemotaxis protein
MLVQAGTQVMIVDDDVQLRQSVAEILETEGYEVLSVSTGEAALARLALGAQPAAVILDLWLPGMGSAEFARRLRGRSGDHIPIIVLTAWPSWERMDVEADAVLSKPAEAAAIVRAVDKLALVSLARTKRRRAVRAPGPPRTRRAAQRR